MWSGRARQQLAPADAPHTAPRRLSDRRARLRTAASLATARPARQSRRRNAPASDRNGLELHPRPKAEGPRPAGHDLHLRAYAADDEAREFVPLIEDVRPKQLQVELAPVVARR